MARIVINPKVFEDSRDAKCVAYNEALRVVMEEMSFDPVAEPTDEQREFFSDTAYSEDEQALRRTILARICVFDDSVKDPTDEQLQEAVEFLEDVMRAGVPQTPEEQSVVQRAHDMLAKVVSSSRPAGESPAAGGEPPSPGSATEAREPGETAGEPGAGGLSEPPASAEGSAEA